ncbi:MAG: uroporphyrinogen decarboxylase family protein [Candidatus Methanomethylophilaceae archaeon]
MSNVSSEDRVRAIIKGDPTDRVAVFDFSEMVSTKLAGYLWEDVRYDAEKSADAAIELNKKVKTDFVIAPVDANSSFIDLGLDVPLPEDDYGIVKSTYFTTREEIDSKDLPDPGDRDSYPCLYKGIIDKFHALYRKYDDSGVVTIGEAWGPLTTAGFLRGVERLLMDMYLEPDDADKVLKKTAPFVDGIFDAMLSEGGKCLLASDPTASGDLIGPEHFEKYSQPHLAKTIKKWKNKGKITMCHICGNTNHLAAEIAETGVDIFSVDWQVDLAQAKKDLGGVTLLGNLHPTDVVWKGTPELIMKESKRCIDAAGEGGKFILGCGCDTPRDTPLENIAAMTEAAEKYGKY